MQIETRVVCGAAAKYFSTHGTPRKPEQLGAYRCIIDLNAREPFGPPIQRQRP
jgi:hypothetical protein